MSVLGPFVYNQLLWYAIGHIDMFLTLAVGSEVMDDICITFSQQQIKRA